MRSRIAVNPFIPYDPHAKQLAAHSLQEVPEVFYGGAAGGGKSDWLLAEMSFYADTVPTAGIIFRESYPLLSHEPDGLIPRSHKWWGPTAARWAGSTKTWHFPTGATISFGYLYNERDHHKYAGPQYQVIGWDEVTEIRGQQYRFLFSRLRRTLDPRLKLAPLRYRAASNPGGRSHSFFRGRFNLPEGPVIGGRRAYMPAFAWDNPHLDLEAYLVGLEELAPVDRERLLRGDWTAMEGGTLFDPEWFPIIRPHQLPTGMTKFVRYWDLAATEVQAGVAEDPDWTVGMLWGEFEGDFFILDVVRGRWSSKGVEDTIRDTAALDGKEVPIVIEQEPGSSGKALIDTYRRKVLPGYSVYPDKPSGSKEVRARPVSSVAEAGDVYLLYGAWNEDFLEEVALFPREDVHDDQVDTLSGGHTWLTGKGRGRWGAE